MTKRICEPWYRQPGEGAKAYQAFVIFRDMGPDRVVADVAKAMGRASAAMIYKWSAQNNWQERVRQYENHLQKVATKAAEKARTEMLARHANEAMLMQQIALQKLREVNPETVTVGDAVKMVDVAVKVERLARGEPTENVKEETSGEVKVLYFPMKANTLEEWAEEVADEGTNE